MFPSMGGGTVQGKTTSDTIPTRRIMRRGLRTTKMMVSLNFLIIILILLVEFVGNATTIAASNNKNIPDNDNDNDTDLLSSLNDDARLQEEGMQFLIRSLPGTLLFSMVLRIIIAIVVEINLDGFLKLVVTPFLTASIVGAVAAPLTFFVGQALQPIIHSICFYGFDDPFLMTILEITGGKEKLLLSRTLSSSSKTGGEGRQEWYQMSIVHKYFLRWCIKSIAGFWVGFAGLCTYIPIIGPILTALLSGWVVTWDMVYIPLASGIGHVGIVRQSLSVFMNFSDYYWFGFWAVLMEEIPIIGPICHVYNVYSAAFFLERVYYWKNNNNNNASMDNVMMGEL